MCRKKLLTTEDVCEILGVSPRWMKKARYHRRIPFVKVGAQTVRYRPEDIDAFINESVVADPLDEVGGDA